MVPVWLLPPASERAAGSPGLAVALKVTGEPLAALSVARALCGPATVPNAQELLAMPFASVGVEAGVMLPFGPVVDQVTVAPAAGAPPSVTTTWSGEPRAWPT